jgi:hypothetical protein
MNITSKDIRRAIRKSVEFTILATFIFHLLYMFIKEGYYSANYLVIWNVSSILLDIIFSATAFITLIKEIGSNVFLSAPCFILPSLVFLFFTLNYFRDNHNPTETFIDFLAVGITHLAYFIGMTWQFIKITRK